MVTQSGLSVNYSRNEEGGKLTLLISKPQAAAVINSSGNTSYGQFCSFTIPPVGSNVGRVTMASSQTSDAFIFNPSGESKYATEIVGELVDGPEVIIKFHATTTVVEEQTKKKATQAITLPVRVSIQNIEVNETKVTVYKTKTVEGVAKLQQATTTNAPEVTNQPDCDVEIKEI